MSGLGPSDDYKALLRGELEPEEYVRRLKVEVDARLRADRRSPYRPNPRWQRNPAKRLRWVTAYLARKDKSVG